MCVRKLRSRIRKLSIELAKSGVTASLNANGLNGLQIWQVTGREPGTVANAIANAYPQLKSTPEGEMFNNSDKTLLGGYFRFALEMDVTTEALRNDPGGIRQLVTLSYQIGHALREDAIVGNPTLVRRIQKLGDYLGAVLSIAEALASPAIFNLRAEIHLTEVSLYLHAFITF